MTYNLRPAKENERIIEGTCRKDLEKAFDKDIEYGEYEEYEWRYYSLSPMKDNQQYEKNERA